MEIKGTAVKSIRDYVLDNYKSEYKSWMDTLPAESKVIYNEAIDASAWYSLKFGGIEPTKKVAELFYKGDYEKAAWESGKYSAQKALTGIYKIFVKASSPAYIVQRASRIFATYYRPCKMEVSDKQGKGVYLVISEMNESDIVIEHRIAGWIHRALEISGAKDLKIEIPKKVSNGDQVTEFDIDWT